MKPKHTDYAPLRHLFLILTLLLHPHETTNAQERAVSGNLYSFNFSGETLAATLEILANETGRDFVYDPSIVSGYHVYYRADNLSLSQILHDILQGSDLDYLVLSSGTYVLVRTTRNPTPYGSLSGRVVDTETGMPLPNATILLADASGGTSSNAAGHFSLNRLLPGKQVIIFSYVGYEPVLKEIEIPPGGLVQEEINLQPGSHQVSPVFITAHQPILPPGGGNLETLQRWSTGNRYGDPIQSLALFSGIQYGIPLSDLHLQGSNSSDHRIYLDSVPVYHPYSFGRLYSAFSPYALDRIIVEKAGFDVRGGSYTAGKVDMTHDTGNRRGTRALYQLDPLFTNVRVDIGKPAQKNRTYNLMVAFRSTFWNWYSAPSLSSILNEWDLVDPVTWAVLLGEQEESSHYRAVQNRSDINQNDLHIAGRYELDPYRSVSFTMYHGGNQIGTSLLASDSSVNEVSQMFSNDRYSWDNIVTRLRYDWLATSRLSIGFQTSYSSNLFSHRYAMFDDASITDITGSIPVEERFARLEDQISLASFQRNRNRIRHFSSTSDLEYSVSPDIKLLAGLQYDHVYSRLEVNDLFYLPTLATQKSDLISGYSGLQWLPRPNLTLSTGSRATTFFTSDKVFLEPRASIQFERPESVLGYWSVKLSGGLYRQFINQFDITNPGPSSLVPGFTIWAHDHTLEQPKAWHSALSFLVDPWESTSFRLEVYRKVQPVAWVTSYHNLMVDHDIDRRRLESFAEKSNLKAWGAGAIIQHTMFDHRLHLMAGYDLSISRVHLESQFGRTLPSPWNEPHRIQARSIFRLSSNWTVVSAWQSIYGRAWAFRQSYYDFMIPHNLTHAGNHIFTEPENDQLRPFHQLDTSVIFRPEVGFANLELRLNLINLLNRRNHIDWNLIPVTGSPEPDYQIIERRLPGFTPSISAKISF